MKQLKSYYNFTLLILITLSSCTSSNSTVDDEINALSNSNAKTYTKQQLARTVYLENDSVYNQKDKTPYTGIIQILENYKYVKSNGEIAEKHGIAAVFNIQNGSFTGEQIYSTTGTTRSPKRFLKTMIIPQLDMVQGIDYIEVEEGQPHDFSRNLIVTKIYYKIINHKFFTPFNISIFWANGNLLHTAIYSFSDTEYIKADLIPAWTKYLRVEGKSNPIRVYHYNGNLAYDGKVEDSEISVPFMGIYGSFDDASKMSIKGSFYDFEGKKIDKATFFIPLGLTKAEISADDFKLDIPDEEYKCYRKFFSTSF